MTQTPATFNRRQNLDGRMAGLRTERYSWWVTWGDLAKYILPRRYRWLVTPNQQRGQQVNQAIIDSTGTIAARVLASGMMSGITSPTRPWFRLRIADFNKDEINPVNIWLAEVERRMMRVFQESNFYNSIAVMYMDLVIFGTAPMIIYENYENVICCYNPCAGEYFLAISPQLYVNLLAREFVQTVPQLVAEYGLENCSQTVQDAYKQNGASLSQEITVRHIVEVNIDGKFPEVPSSFKYREVYWEIASTENDKFLRVKGFEEQPFIGPRWDTVGNDAYGRSTGMDAIGDIKQLQQETKRKAQAIDKLANPPMVADVDMKNQPASTIPGGVTYVTKKDGIGFKPAYENFRPPIQELMADIEKVQERIKVVFFNDLFLMISQLQTVRTATEIDARREEKLIMLGPVLERLQTEALDIIIDRVFGIMSRKGLLPPAPAEIGNKQIDLEYMSMLAAAQDAVQTSGLERVFQVIGNSAGVHPEVVDCIKWDDSIKYYGARLAVPPSLFPTAEEIAAVREARAKQQQLATNAELSKGAADAAKNLSNTNVGGGKNALETMLAGGSA